MAFHHVAFATADLAATHHFYTEAMGFELVKAVEAPTPEGGWARHVFYDTGGGGLIAFWDLHVDAIPTVKSAISKDLGLPEWVNHIAFDAPDEAAQRKAKERWLSFGLDVFEIDHGFCRSIYAVDPGGTLVEWCMDTRLLDADDRARANAVIGEADHGEFDPEPVVSFHPGDPSLRPVWGQAGQAALS